MVGLGQHDCVTLKLETLYSTFWKTPDREVGSSPCKLRKSSTFRIGIDSYLGRYLIRYNNFLVHRSANELFFLNLAASVSRSICMAENSWGQLPFLILRLGATSSLLMSFSCSSNPLIFEEHSYGRILDRI